MVLYDMAGRGVPKVQREVSDSRGHSQYELVFAKSPESRGQGDAEEGRLRVLS